VYNPQDQSFAKFKIKDDHDQTPERQPSKDF
jgi:hypothetical protein